MQLLFLFTFYQFLQLLSLAFIPLILLTRRLKGKRTIGNWREKCGFVPKLSENNKKVIWLHAVSVGELLSIEHIIKRIKQELPETSCYVTCGTITGKNIAQQQLDADAISFLPFDLLPCMLVAFSRIKPSALIIVEADFWPNFLMLAHWKKIPVYCINARLRKQTFPRYQKFGFFLRPLINIIHTLFVQSTADKERFRQFGIQSNKLVVMGNIKAWNVLHKHTKIKKESQQVRSHPPTLLVGSMHPGEEHLYLDLFKRLKKDFQALKLILAPRHFHWRHTLEETVKKSGTRYVIWDEQNADIAPCTLLEKHDILLVCMLGNLFNLYPLADIYFLGGTFVPVGGHNLLEPAVWSKPTIIGPYYENCKDIADKLEKHGGLIKIAQQHNVEKTVAHLLANPNQHRTMGIYARKWLEVQAKSVGRSLYKLENMLTKEIMKTSGL